MTITLFFDNIRFSARLSGAPQKDSFPLEGRTKRGSPKVFYEEELGYLVLNPLIPERVMPFLLIVVLYSLSQNVIFKKYQKKKFQFVFPIFLNISS